VELLAGLSLGGVFVGVGAPVGVMGLATGNSLVIDLAGMYSGPRAPHALSVATKNKLNTREEIGVRIVNCLTPYRMAF